MQEKRQQLLGNHDRSLEDTCQLTSHKAEMDISEVNQMTEYL